MSEPLVCMVLIGRNEAHNIERCFSSWWDDVDRVVFCDTGSKDQTIPVAKRFAAARKQSRKLKVVRFKWVDDFSAARNYADSFATTPWICWADMDDEIHGLGAIRDLAATAADDVSGFFCRYNYAQDAAGNTISELWRERLVRNDGTKWEGRLHEHKILDGHVIQVPEDVADWVHHRRIDDQASGHRNLRILKGWDEEDPDNPRVLQSLGLEYLGANDWKSAIDVLSRYLEHPSEQPDRRAQAIRYLGQALLMDGRVDEAKNWAFRALAEHWAWTDTHLTLAEVAQTKGQPDIGLMHAKTAYEMGKPNSILILNPTQYTAHPLALMTVCLMQLNRFDEAMQAAHRALEIVPDYPLLAAHMPMWQSHILREQTVNAWLSCVKLLEDYGEIAKATELLSVVPFYAKDDPRLIARRTGLWLRPADEVAALERESAAGKFIERHLEMAA